VTQTKQPPANPVQLDIYGPALWAPRNVLTGAPLYSINDRIVSTSPVLS
jgi:hypothetical protein